MGPQGDEAERLVQLRPLYLPEKPVSRESKRTLVWGLGLRYQTMLEACAKVLGRAVRSEADMSDCEARRVIRAVRRHQV